jgi:hypothetical protein
MSAGFPEILPFPLFHGTSSIWRASIEAHGLGGRDVIQELHARECFRAIVIHLDNLPSHRRPDEYVLGKLRLLASQAVDEGLNFRHGGGVYLTPSRQTALSYAHNR